MARSKVTVIFYQPGFAAIRTAPKVMEMINEKAQHVGALANGSGTGTFIVHPAEHTGGRVRGRAAVVTGDIAAMRMQSRGRILERALNGQGLIKYTSKAGNVSYITQKQYDNYTRGSR